MRVLHVLSELDNGGVAHILYDYCSRLSDKFDFDFVVSVPNEGAIEKRLVRMGCNVYHIPQIHEGLLAHNKKLSEVIRAKQYDVVHDHSDYKGVFTMIIAKICGVKTRISHSHRTVVSETKQHSFVGWILTKLTKLFATNLCACGADAAIGIWGESTFRKGLVQIIRNGIDIANYKFSYENRNDFRERYGLNEKIVVGNVGRFVFQKNQEFLIEIFKSLKAIRNDVALVLIGNGNDEGRIKKIVDTYGLSNDVLFLGSRNDVPKLLSAMDVFVLPSRYEGLPIVLVEVQANGLPALVSDSVTKEIQILDNLEYISLKIAPEEWAKRIVELSSLRNENAEALKTYDIENNCQELECFYKKCIKSNC